ncbi:MAG: rRNA maturation RNase YbeY [Actinomycetota bacterium]
MQVEVVAADERDLDDVGASPESPVDLGRWRALAAAVVADLGGRGELTLTFVDRATMQTLNTEWMGIDRPTDVLAAQLDAPGEPGADSEPVLPLLLGDVVVCPAVAVDQFADHAGTYVDEIALLVVHGILHVFGHDHADPDEATAMRSEERRLLERYHWHGPTPDGFRHEH